MATRRYIADLRPGDTVEDEVFVINKKELRQSQNGSKFISLVVSDKRRKGLRQDLAGDRQHVQNDPAGRLPAPQARIDEYRGELQMIVEGIKPVDPTSVNLADLLPCTTKDVEVMWKRTVEILLQIKSKDLLILLKQFIGVSGIRGGLQAAPAASFHHAAQHPRVMEHTLSLLETGRRSCRCTRN